jgi:hypothetical protein
LVKKSNQFLFNFKSQEIKVSEYIHATKGITAIFFVLDIGKLDIELLDKKEINEFLDLYESKLWNLRKTQTDHVEELGKKMRELDRKAKIERIFDTLKTLEPSRFKKNLSILQCFKSRMILTVISNELSGITKIDLDADVTSVIKETDRWHTGIHQINTKYSEYTIQHAMRMFLDGLARVAEAATFGTAAMTMTTSVDQIVHLDFANIEGMIIPLVISGASAFAMKYGRKIASNLLLSFAMKLLIKKLA